MDDTVKIQLAFNIEFLWITGLFHSSCETCPEEYMKNNYNSIFQTCFMHVSVVTASARGATGEKVGKANTGSRLFPLLCVPRSFCPSRWHTKLCYIGKLEKRMDLSQKYLSCFLSLDTTGKGNWQHSLQTTIQMPISLGHNLKPWFFT